MAVCGARQLARAVQHGGAVGRQLACAPGPAPDVPGEECRKNTGDRGAWQGSMAATGPGSAPVCSSWLPIVGRSQTTITIITQHQPLHRAMLHPRPSCPSRSLTSPAARGCREAPWTRAAARPASHAGPHGTAAAAATTAGEWSRPGSVPCRGLGFAGGVLGVGGVLRGCSRCGSPSPRNATRNAQSVPAYPLSPFGMLYAGIGLKYSTNSAWSCPCLRPSRWEGRRRRLQALAARRSHSEPRVPHVCLHPRYTYTHTLPINGVDLRASTSLAAAATMYPTPEEYARASTRRPRKSRAAPGPLGCHLRATSRVSAAATVAHVKTMGLRFAILPVHVAC